MSKNLKITDTLSKQSKFYWFVRSFSWQVLCTLLSFCLCLLFLLRFTGIFYAFASIILGLQSLHIVQLLFFCFQLSRLLLKSPTRALCNFLPSSSTILSCLRTIWTKILESLRQIRSILFYFWFRFRIWNKYR